MTKQLEMTGKNKDEAIIKALEQLGLDRDDVSVEILELGKTGFLGIGSVPAKVRVTYEAPEEEPAAPAPEEKPQPPKAAAPAEAPRPSKAPASPKPSKPAKKSPPPEQSKAPAPQPKTPVPQPEQSKVPEGDSAPTDEDVEKQITAFLTGLLDRMGVPATPRITRDGEIYDVVLEGQNLGALIGRRGETLDAIQQLTGYAVNRGRSKRVRIHVDAENYRARREESLRRLANKVAGKVIRSRRSVTLEPMNAYERHVIHAALQDYPGVSTHSVGVEPNRRTVVSYDPEK